MGYDQNSPAIVRAVPSDLEAAVIVSLLASHGIDAVTTEDYTSGYRAEALGWG